MEITIGTYLRYFLTPYFRAEAEEYFSSSLAWG